MESLNEIAHKALHQLGSDIGKAFFDVAPVFSRVKRDYAPVISWAGDTVNIIMGRTKDGLGTLPTKLALMKTTFPVRDMEKAAHDPAFLLRTALPAVIQLASMIQIDVATTLGACRNAPDLNTALLITRRLPTPLPGTGASAFIGSMNDFGYRVMMTYDPTTLGQEFHIDALYSVAVVGEGA